MPGHISSPSVHPLMPVVFVPHGGGPMPLLGDANHRELSHFLGGLAAELPKPRALLVVTAHWEERVVSVSSGESPAMLYDYSGFPPEAYRLNYPAPGSPALAELVAQLLHQQGVAVHLDAQRPYDHGTFVPLMLIYPQAQIPVVQLSLLHSLDAAAHIALGEALAPLREQGVLIIGSGMSFHNMRAFFAPSPQVTAKSLAFDQWLEQQLTSADMAATRQQLSQWQAAPEARFCHPREEHLLPLHVCFGAASAAGTAAQKIFSGLFFHTWVAGYRWG